MWWHIWMLTYSLSLSHSVTLCRLPSLFIKCDIINGWPLIIVKNAIKKHEAIFVKQALYMSIKRIHTGSTVEVWTDLCRLRPGRTNATLLFWGQIGMTSIIITVKFCDIVHFFNGSFKIVLFKTHFLNELKN